MEKSKSTKKNHSFYQIDQNKKFESKCVPLNQDLFDKQEPHNHIVRQSEPGQDRFTTDGGLSSCCDDSDYNSTYFNMNSGVNSKQNGKQNGEVKNQNERKKSLSKQNINQKQVNVNILLLANPKAGSQLARRFITEYQQENHKLVIQDHKMITCKLSIYDVTNKDDKVKYFQHLESLIPSISPENLLNVAIMGGDGSLAQTIKELKTNDLISKNLTKIFFCLLPYGTGNDTGQVFGWGNQPGKWGDNLEVLMNSLLAAIKDQLTLWNVKVDGDLYDVYDKPIKNDQILLTCYFNIGIDAEIGANFERTRTKSRCCNKILYAFHGFMKVFDWGKANKVVKDYISRVKYTPANRHQKIVTDMNHVHADPLNMIGMNIPSIYGGILKQKYWESKHDDKLYDRLKMLRSSGVDVKGWDIESSSNEEEEKFAQRYDDDKMELLGASDKVNFSLFRMSQFGQARSPFTIEFRDDLDKDHEIYFAVDGEFFKIKNAKKIEFKVDTTLPRIKMLRFNPSSLPY